MKRLIIVCMILLSTVADASESFRETRPSVIIQSEDEKNSKNADDGSITITNVHQINLDTTQIDGGGNWLNKRIWYERSQGIFDEIRTLASTVDALRIQFTNEVNAVGQKIDSFWESVDFTRAQLEDRCKEILAKLDAEQKLVGDLSVDERNLQTTIKQELPTIDQLGKDIKVIHDIDEKIDQTLDQAFKTIDECHDFEAKAWETFKSIGKELDDKKARTLYYQMHNYKENIDQKNNYLKATLFPYLHNMLVAKVEMNISKINQTIDQLKNKGVDLDKIMNKCAEEDILQLHAREKEATEIAVKKALEEEQAQAKIAADKVAKEAKQALDEAQKNSFNNVVNHYYDQTIGKIIGFFHQGYFGAAFDYIASCFSYFYTSYSYPILTYCSHGIGSIKNYMENIVLNVTTYFGGKGAKNQSKENNAPIVDKADEKPVEQAVKIEQPVVAPVAASTVPAVSSSAAVVDVATVGIASATPLLTVDTPSTSSSTTDQVPAAPVSDSSTTGIATATPLLTVDTSSNATSSDSEKPTDKEKSDNTTTVSSDAVPAKDDTVVVQSLQDDNDTKPYQSNAYHLFKSFLDCIGTVFVSIYNCIAQFFTFLWKVSTYISSN